MDLTTKIICLFPPHPNSVENGEEGYDIHVLNAQSEQGKMGNLIAVTSFLAITKSCLGGY